MAATIDKLNCTGSDNYPSITTGTKLGVLYLDNVNLTAAESPYWVINDVAMQEGIVVNIESNVEIKFAGDYIIYIKGQLITSCDVSATTNDLGLSNEISFIKIGTDTNSTHEGRITITQTGSALICNTKFHNMGYGLYLESYGNVRIDNCEFENNDYAIYRSSGRYYTASNITDSIFLDNVQSVYFACNVQIENNYFSSPNSVWRRPTVFVSGDWTLINNNTFIYGGDNSSSSSDAALELITYGGRVEYNDFSDYYAAIISHSKSFIKYNTFTNNQKAILINTSSDQEINYNNFINNVYSIELNNDENQENCNYNYHGSSSTDKAVISQQFDDICSGHSLGKFFYTFLYCLL